MRTRLYSRYRRKHDGFTVDVFQSPTQFTVHVPPLGSRKMQHAAGFETAAQAAHAASKSAQAGRPVWLPKK